MRIKHMFKTLSIKRKLMFIMLLSSSFAILLMASLVIVNQTINSQQAIQQQLVTLADVLGTRSTAALTYDDPETAEEILNGLALKPNIIYAHIVKQNGEKFAAFGVLSKSDLVQQLRAQQVNRPMYKFWADLISNEMLVDRDIYLENELIGEISIVSTLDGLYQDLRHYMILIAIISGVSFVITIFICTRLQKVVSDPILNLQQAMRTVSENKDYSLRVENQEHNELGFLIDSFNRMLKQIQIRDGKLAEYSIHLEKTVAKRTLQLTDANKKRIFWLETMARFLRHELKNSSVGIKTSLDLIDRRNNEQKKVAIYIERARKSMDNMNALLKSAGDASDLEATLYKEELKPLNLFQIINNHLESYETIFPNALITINGQPDVMIAGNEDRIIQLMDKLISNAVEHSDRLKIINVRVFQQHNQAKLLVSNEGIPLPEDKQSIFDLFVSLRSVEQKTDENVGLGLYIVKLIAESHQGQVHAYDLASTTGAVFEIVFPVLNSDS